MLGGQVALLTYQAGTFLATGEVPGPLGNAHPIIAPYDTFATADGHVNIAVGNDAIWGRFCAALGLEGLRDDPRFATNADRITNKAALYGVLEETLGALPTADLVARLDVASVPCGPIRDVAESLGDPQTRSQELVQEMPHPALGTVAVPGFPYRFGGTPLAVRHPPPLLGQHTAEVLAEVGFGPDAIAALVAEGTAQIRHEG